MILLLMSINDSGRRVVIQTYDVNLMALRVSRAGLVLLTHG